MGKANKKKKNKSQKPAVQNAKANVQNQEVNQPVLEEQTAVEEITEQKVESKPAVEQQKKVEKKEKVQKTKAQKQPNPKQNKVKETVAELTKVTWPTFPKVVKNTLLVLVIVLISTAVLFGIDYVLSLLYKLLTPSA